MNAPSLLNARNPNAQRATVRLRLEIGDHNLGDMKRTRTRTKNRVSRSSFAATVTLYSLQRRFQQLLQWLEEETNQDHAVKRR